MSVDAQWRADITRQMQESAKAQQETAVALERILGRLNAMERWQNDADERRERQEERRDDRDDKRPDERKASLALIVAACGVSLNLLSGLVGLVILVATHWKG